jgi:hypothetical protein
MIENRAVGRSAVEGCNFRKLTQTVAKEVLYSFKELTDFSSRPARRKRKVRDRTERKPLIFSGFSNFFFLADAVISRRFRGCARRRHLCGSFSISADSKLRKVVRKKPVASSIPPIFRISFSFSFSKEILLFTGSAPDDWRKSTGSGRLLRFFS